MTDLLLFPFGGNAREALLALLAQNEISHSWNPLGFIDDNEMLWGEACCGIPVLGGRERLNDFPSARVLAVPGSPNNFRGRRELIGGLGLQRERYATIIDPSARIAPDARIGKNTLLMANVVISCSVRIGDHCVILPNTVIAHESTIGNYALVGSNVSVSGGCVIGENCYIGSGASIRENLCVGPGSLVGMAANILGDVPPDSVVAGNPARILKTLRRFQQ
ncbi:MAG: acetyltransferase [Deltaproteobacteria bacterium]|nr:acetyltransferase [Deltaproteobacteria bacterium]MBW2139265.1 acetyltransferase [Deltaproteobacteria bacterium]